MFSRWILLLNVPSYVSFGVFLGLGLAVGTIIPSATVVGAWLAAHRPCLLLLLLHRENEFACQVCWGARLDQLIATLTRRVELLSVLVGCWAVCPLLRLALGVLDSHAVGFHWSFFQ